MPGGLPENSPWHRHCPNLGVPPHVVQAIAGHAAVKITLKVWAHANLDAMRQALGKLDGGLS